MARTEDPTAINNPHDSAPIGMQFLVTVLPERVDELAITFRQAGVGFDPNTDLISIDRQSELVTSGVNFGKDIPDLIAGINLFLRRRGETALVRDDPEKWSAQERFAFLQMATTEFGWHGFQVERAWWLDREQRWEPDVVAQRREVPWAATPGQPSQDR